MKAHEKANRLSDEIASTGKASTDKGWRVKPVFAIPSALTILLACVASIIVLNLLPPRALLAQSQDTTPPNLTALSFNPAIDTTSSSADVTVNFTVTDNLSGAELFAIRFRSPSGTSDRTNNVFFTPALNRSGSLNVHFPQFGEAGIWIVASVTVRDAVGNNTNLTTAQLDAMGFPTELTVTSIEDNTAPSLTALSFTPSIDTSLADASVSVSFEMTDDLSGANLIAVRFRSPSGSFDRTNNIFFPPTLNKSGSLSVFFPRFSEAGTWTLQSVTVGDEIGNRANLSTAQIAALGFPTELTVISVQDVMPPNLTDFSFSPVMIDTTTGDASVTVSFASTDDISGVNLFAVRFRSPTGSIERTNNIFFSPSLNKTGSLVVTFPQFSELGTWIVSSVAVGDEVGNRLNLSPADLAARGFPTELLNEPSPQNRPPEANAGLDRTIECSSHSGTPVTLDASASTDPDGDQLIYTWRENGNVIAGPTNSAQSIVLLGNGTHNIVLTVDDGHGESDSDDLTVTISDTESPQITLTIQQIELWPPNHQYHTINVSDLVASASDNCSGDLTQSVVIAQVISDEPDDAPGGGDGNTVNDIVIAENNRSVQLRAERAGNGNGRVYTITFAVSDAAGNVTTTTAIVTVPKSQGNK